jgi:hypothetical protein
MECSEFLLVRRKFFLILSDNRVLVDQECFLVCDRRDVGCKYVIFVGGKNDEWN